MTAMEDLEGLLANLPGYALLTTKQKQTALDASVLPDSLGVWPGEEGYAPTYDEFFAAASLLPFLQAQPVVRQTSSEGTSVAVDAPSWAGLRAYYLSMSPVARASAGTVLGVIEIPNTPHVHRTLPEMEGNDYDVDTDAS